MLFPRLLAVAKFVSGVAMGWLHKMHRPLLLCIKVKYKVAPNACPVLFSLVLSCACSWVGSVAVAHCHRHCMLPASMDGCITTQLQLYAACAKLWGRLPVEG